MEEQIKQRNRQAVGQKAFLQSHSLLKIWKRQKNSIESRCVMTIHVDDVDAMCAKLTQRGVTLLNGPMDRPWGIRTASFKDPAGYIWEIAK